MTLQFIKDPNGNTTGVYIPIEEWQDLKSKYTDLEKAETDNLMELTTWQKQIIDHRLNDYYNNSDDVEDFDETMNDIEKSL
jgi:hypothetical protein